MKGFTNEGTHRQATVWKLRLHAPLLKRVIVELGAAARSIQEIHLAVGHRRHDAAANLRVVAKGKINGPQTGADSRASPVSSPGDD